MAKARKAAKKTDARAARARAILAELRQLYPKADCALVHENPFELLVATILSAQCTDVRVNLVCKDLFPRYPTPRHFAEAKASEIEAAIRSTGFFRNKTKSLQGMAKALLAEHGGEVPRTMAELVELPGVARKTANVVLGTAFGKNEGVVVDTHIFRLARRLGLSDEEDTVKVERDLMGLFPRARWTYLGHALIQHGRAVCAARKPACADCTLAPLCPSAFRV